MPFRSTSRIFAALFGALACVAVLSAPGAFATGMDTPNGVTSLPFNIEGTHVMTMTQTGLGIGLGTASPSYPLDVAGDFNLRTGNYLRQNGATAFITSGPNTYNTFVGQSSGTPALLTGGTLNTSLGFGALQSGSTAQSNTALGVNALSASTAGNANTAVGVNALVNSTSSYNTALGASAGTNLTSGSQNIMIGFSATAPSAAGVGQINIGNLIFGTGATGSVGNPAGNVGIGMTSPSAPLDVEGGIRGSAATGNSCSPEGMIAYDTANHTFVYCPQGGGATWTAVNFAAITGFIGRQWTTVQCGNNNNFGKNYGMLQNTHSYPIEISAWFQNPNGAGGQSISLLVGTSSNYTLDPTIQTENIGAGQTSVYGMVPPSQYWGVFVTTGNVNECIFALE